MIFFSVLFLIQIFYERLEIFWNTCYIMGSFRYVSGYVPFYKWIISFLFPSSNWLYLLERFSTKLMVTFLENERAGYICGTFSFLSLKYLFFYILIISDFSSKWKLFIITELTLYKNLYENVILRGHVFAFLQIVLQLSFRFIAHIK